MLCPITLRADRLTGVSSSSSKPNFLLTHFTITDNADRLFPPLPKGIYIVAGRKVVKGE